MDSSNFYLPESLMHKIFEFLPSKDLIWASVTCKAWRSAWISYPVFEFNEKSILDFNKNTKLLNQPDFHDYANRSLTRWVDNCDDNRVNIEKLSLKKIVCGVECFSRCLELVAIATSRNVKVIELQCRRHFYWRIYHSDYLWSLLASSKSVEVLSIDSISVYLFSSLPVNYYLKKLTLSDLIINTINYNFGLHNLLSGFPLLEDLVLSYCSGISEVRISGPNKLMTLEVISCDCPEPRVVIEEAVNLRSIVYSTSEYYPGIISFSNCKLLTSLQIVDTDLHIAGCISQIPLLENLTLKNCVMPENESFEISHSNLKSLKLLDCISMSKAEFKTPNLRLFQYRGGIFQISSFNYCSGLLNAKLKLDTKSFECTNWFWFINNFLETFSRSKLVLTVDCHLEEELGDHDFVLAGHPLFELKHFNITDLELSKEDSASFIFIMLELFPCVENLFLNTSFATIIIMFHRKDRSFTQCEETKD